MSFSEIVNINNYNNQVSSTPALSDQDHINTLPKDLLNEIFSLLDFKDLNICSQVCKSWKAEVDDPEKSKKRMYKLIAFTPEDWSRSFENVIFTDLERQKAFSSLPNDIYKILKSACPAFSGKRVSDTHLLVWIPKDINGISLTLNTLGELAKKYFPTNASGFRHIEGAIVKQEGAKPIDQSCWVLMTKDVLPGSRNKGLSRSYDGPTESIDMDLTRQKSLVFSTLTEEAQTAYEVPTVLKLAVCVLTHYFKSGERLFSESETHAVCQETINWNNTYNGTTRHYPILVGYFSEKGLFLHYGSVGPTVGVAAMRKL